VSIDFRKKKKSFSGAKYLLAGKKCQEEAMMNEEDDDNGFDEIDLERPICIGEFIRIEDEQPNERLLSSIAVNEIVDRETFLKGIRDEWGIGRMLPVLRELQTILKNVRKSNAMVAEQMRVTPATISHWFAGRTGVSHGNFEVLQRTFSEYWDARRFSNSAYQDLCGYIRAISRQRFGAKVELIQFLSTHQFFFLWCVFRTKSLADAIRTKKFAEVDVFLIKAELFAQNISLLYGEPDEGIVRVIDKKRTLLDYGIYFYCVVRGLDRVCWSRPNN